MNLFENEYLSFLNCYATFANNYKYFFLITFLYTFVSQNIDYRCSNKIREAKSET